MVQRKHRKNTMTTVNEREKRRKMLLKRSTDWVLDISRKDIFPYGYAHTNIPSKFISIDLDTNTLNTNRVLYWGKCPGTLVGVISNKGREHVDRWLEKNPNWIKVFSSPTSKIVE